MKIPLFEIDRYPDSVLGRRPADLLKIAAQRDRFGYTLLEVFVRPCRFNLAPSGAIFFWDVARGDRPGSGIPNSNSLDQLSKLADVARIRAINKIFAYVRVEL